MPEHRDIFKVLQYRGGTCLPAMKVDAWDAVRMCVITLCGELIRCGLYEQAISTQLNQQKMRDEMWNPLLTSSRC